jgi:hypothetical protein
MEDDQTSFKHARREARIRTRAVVEVACASWEGYLPLNAVDASAGGAFVLTAAHPRPPPGSSVALRVGALVLTGKVAHVIDATQAAAQDRYIGFGVSLVKAQQGQWWVPQRRIDAEPSGIHPRPLLAILPEPASSLFYEGCRLFEASHFLQAKHKFAEAAAASPEPQISAMQAVCSGFQYLGHGMIDTARDSFQRALELDPSCAEARAGLRALEARGAK